MTALQLYVALGIPGLALAFALAVLFYYERMVK